MTDAKSTDAAAPLPAQIPFIIGNEGCERFSFYGMRNILTQFLSSSALLFAASEIIPQAEREGAAKEVFHTFVIGVYFFPLLGGWLSDRFLGKYRTILYLSLVYCVGQLCLSLADGSKNVFFAGLFLIALGSGGIKPCVSAFVGDQFDATNKHRAKVVFDAFYWIINFGSFFATLLMPLLLKTYGARVAFGVPGVLMLIATVIFWWARNRYVMVAPTRGDADPHAFFKVARTALLSTQGGTRTGLALALAGVMLACGCVALIPLTETFTIVTGLCLALVVLMACGGAGTWLQIERARGVHPDVAVDGARGVLRVLVVFALVTPFWSLFDQKASTWVLQANAMSKPAWFQSSQMQALNPALVMLLIPFNNLVLFPMLRRAGFEPTALRRMATGIAFSGLAWIVVGLMQLRLDGGNTFSIVWQVLPYALLTFGEVLVSATGLEFAYSQAPPAMKSVVMSVFNLSVTIGNLWVLLVNATVKNEAVTMRIADTGFGVTAFQMFFFAAFALVAALAFVVYARSYVVADFYRKPA